MSAGFLGCNDEIDIDDVVLPTEKLDESFIAIQSATEAASKDEKLKPKRPLSAYNWFFHSERQKILQETPTRKEGKPRRSHGKVGFADLARMIAAKWKNLSKEDRAVFDEKAAIDKNRYLQEMELWKEKQSVTLSHSNLANAGPYRAPLSFMNDPNTSSFVRQSSNLFRDDFNSGQEREMQNSDEMKVSGTDYFQTEPYSLTNAFGAQLTRRIQTAVPQMTSSSSSSSQDNAPPSLDTLASRLGDESTQLFLQLFGDQ